MTPTLAEVTRQLLQTYNRLPRKRLGQHFLVDPQVVQRIIRAAAISGDDLVVEIGSGLGVVTAEIAAHCRQLIAIEIDKELLKISQEVLRGASNVDFVAADILKTDLDEITHGRRYKIIGNLPYYITAPIVEKILTAANKPELAVIMTQKEVAERMAASPGTKKYGSFSVFTQFYARVKIESLISKSSFQPWPEVSSALVSLIPYSSPLFPGLNEKLFFNIVHAAFQQRRKKLKNSLAEFNLAGVDFDFSRRPETLSVEEFARLANLIHKNTANRP